MKKFLVVFLLFFAVSSTWAFPPGTFKGDNSPNQCINLVKKLPKQPLSPAEKEGLFKMIEEEKLAHDVYYVLFQRWQLRVFNNISRSEQRHIDMVKTLIEKYGLKNPVEGLDVGQFKTEEMQKLYKKLVRQGMASLGEAVKVGALIEEMDIYDLQQELKKTDNEDIRMVYQNLMKGSRNHLRVFGNWIEKMGLSYTPQYLSKQEFAKIVSSPKEMGPVDAQGKPMKINTK
ncbi:DUF2202 domain-containing protein [Thermodesulfatator autotrophicus]|uniref:DUF2202 domain-containing protein n=1 Tax=Thermodesulfatator autotrophicus TaxID=1795632 RepID=A0A177E8E4_9BACT|nr:DUF2202 domain-containing protein [Thermodesulfatator autotrophicus]OAG28224.1 hypothetical protein TH606_02945 [Thermodesulfatator autotrophicus]